MGDSGYTSSSSLAPFFRKLDERMKKVPAVKKYRFHVDIGSRKLELCFDEKKQAAIIERCLAGRILENESILDARFHFWIDDVSNYIDRTDICERWRCRDESGWFICTPGHSFIGLKISDRDFYYCIHAPGKTFPIPYWAVSVLVYYWAGTAGLLPLHGGAVGVEGKGVLLAAKGGGGKSTLAACCMRSGMDFITDDYLLISTQGPLVARPLFSTIKMNLDMKNRLALNLPVIWTDESREGKQILDASVFSVCSELPLHAVVFLSFSEEEEPYLESYRKPVAVKLIQMMLLQVEAYEPAAISAIIRRISQLPAYEMRLSKNLDKNAEKLRKWIERI